MFFCVHLYKPYYRVDMKLPTLKIIYCIAAILSLVSCGKTESVNRTISGLDPLRFDSLVDGRATKLYTLTNDIGMEVCITNYGARVVSLMTPDRDGNLRDVVLGFDNIADYMANVIPFGATIGRCTNRIRDARFEIDGVEYNLSVNDGDHSTHGGVDGWSFKIYDVVEATSSRVVMHHLSPDKESGYPGSVDAYVTYTLTNDGSLQIDYRATTDAPTIVNLTNHNYYALTGDPTKSAMGARLMMNADKYTPKAEDNIPSGEIESVENTPLDFRTPQILNDVLKRGAEFHEIKSCNGFAVNMMFDRERDEDQAVVELYEPSNGIVMEMFTSQPSVQFFSCNAYDKVHSGKNGIVYNIRNAICLETQIAPNAVNFEGWDSPVLRPGEVYEEYCRLKFSTSNM